MPNRQFNNKGNRNQQGGGGGYRGSRGGGGGRGDGSGYRGGGKGGKSTPPPMQHMPSPYNFVAVEDQVAPAETPERISHDTPFQDGLSGWIGLEVEATTPIYIRGAGDFKDYRKGSGQGDSEFVTDCRAVVGSAGSQAEIGNTWQNRDNFKAFTDHYRLPDGRPAIPGTSLRGVVRNLLEMVTNSRLGPVNDRRYAVRDLNNDDRTLYGGWMTEMKKSPKGKQIFEPYARAGWLRIEDGDWTIEPCEFARIEHSFLGNEIGRKKSAEEKYKAYKQAKKSREVQFRIEQHGLEGGLRYDAAVPEKNGPYSGALVFTGSPNKKKHLEFVFYKASGQRIQIQDERVIKGFKQTHSDERDDPTGAWSFWLKELKANKEDKIPIFYLAYETKETAGPDKPTIRFKEGSYLHAFGLAMMFRLAYRHTLREAVPANHREERIPNGQFDFVEGLFGYQRSDRDEGLRGRLAFGPCAAPKDATQLPPVVTVLSAPKPTYYPNYFEQTFDPKGDKLAAGKAYATLMDDDEQRRLRGWKFYPAHPDQHDPSKKRHASEADSDYRGGDVVPLPPSNNEEQRAYKTATAFRPLAAGTRFTGRLRFHNLRPAELGALVWALTWGDRDDLRHRIGMAKPLGYGCARLRIVGGRVIPNDPSGEIKEWDQPGDTPFLLDQAMDAFASRFAKRLASPAIEQDLLSMANPRHGRTLRYPTLDPRNEFADAKKAHLVLPRWRVLDGRAPGQPAVDKSAAPKQGGGGGGKRGGSHSGGKGWQPQGGGRLALHQASPVPSARHSVGDIVECEVAPGKQGKKKLQVAGGQLHESGGLALEAQARASELPEVGSRIRMRIAHAGAGGYQFTFPD